MGSLGSAGGGTFARGKSQRVFWPLEGRSVWTEGGSWSSSGRGGIRWILGGLHHFSFGGGPDLAFVFPGIVLAVVASGQGCPVTLMAESWLSYQVGNDPLGPVSSFFIREE